MRQWGTRERARARIEIIPMIDVMMFLLVFFVLISINVIPALGVRTTLPQSGNPDQIHAKHQLVITLLRNGDVQLDGANVDLTLLGDLLAERRGQGQDLSVTINGDEGVTLQRLVAVFDVLKTKGFQDVAIATQRRS
jgi:biopolymer transport protein ExbD